MAAVVDRAAKAGAFVDWLLEHGGYVHPSLNLFAKLPNGDYGVRAEKAIKENEQLLLVPKSLCIYIRDHQGATGQAEPDSRVLELVRGMKLSPFLSTVLVLMASRAQGAEGKYAPYIDTLPEQHDCLMAWSEEERAQLQGTDLEDRKESAQSVFKREVEPLLAAHPDAWPPAACGPAAFEWACCNVQSRAFHLVKQNWITHVQSEGTDLYLIPGIDMINHSTQPARRSTTLELVEQPLTVRCGDPPRELTLQGYFTMKADRDIAEGEEVLHTYGDLSDAQLLQTYGFVEAWGPGEGNPHNVAFIPSDDLVAACQAIATAMGLDESGGSGGGGGKGRKRRKGAGGEAAAAAPEGPSRRRLLERLGLLPPNMVVLPAEQPLSNELLSVAQVLLMPAQDFQEYAEEFGREPAEEVGGQGEPADAASSTPGEHVVRGVLGRPYLEDPEFREAVVFALLKAVQGCLKRYLTSAEEDAALLAGAAAGGGGGGALGWRAACAVRVRLGEKRVLGRLKQQLMELLAEGGSSGEEGGSSEEDGGSSEEEGGSDSDFGSSEGLSEGEEGSSSSEEEEEEGGSGGKGGGAKRGRAAPRGRGGRRGGGGGAGKRRKQ